MDLALLASRLEVLLRKASQAAPSICATGLRTMQRVPSLGVPLTG